MKKVLLIIISSLLVLSMTGCSLQKPEDHEPEGKTSYADYQIWPVEYPQGYVTPDINAEYASYQKAWEKFELRRKDEEANRTLNSILAPFNKTMMKSLLSGGNDNMVFSPVNLYFNFALLASITQGRSRDELLSLLQINPDTLIEDYQRIWNDNTLTGKDTVSFANSIWLSELLSYKKEAVMKIAADFHAPVFKGNTASEEYAEAFRGWINDNTGNLLKEQVKEIEFDKYVKMALASTIYFKSAYLEPYQPLRQKDVFHGASGDQSVAMMHKSLSTYYLDTGKFSGFIERLTNENMLLILPHEGVSFEELFDDPEFNSALFSNDNEMFRRVMVSATLPPFDATSKVSLKDVLIPLGIEGIFGADPLAFSPISNDELYVDKMEHSCRVIADENGVEAAAYTVETMKNTAIMEERVEIKFDRPFMFIIRSNLDNTILFCGIIRKI